MLYAKAEARDAAAIVKGISEEKPVDRLLYKDKVTNARVVHEQDVPFYAAQQRVLLEHSGYIDPRQH